MFWRRSKRPAGADEAAEGAAEGEDDVAKLQRQFGIKTVSDADVQAEFQRLFGAAGSGNGAESPTAELLRLAGGADADSDDEEAKILRELKISASADLDEVDVSEEEEEDEQRDVREAVELAQRNHEREAAAIERGDASGIGGQQASGSVDGASVERVRELKMRALALKREGNVPAALEVLREAKQMEAALLEQGPATVSTQVTVARNVIQTTSVSTGQAASVVATQSSTQVVKLSSHTGLGGDDEPDVDVTDEDMQDPEFLAQLVSFGHGEDTKANKEDESVSARLASLEAEIRRHKLQALELKRKGDIQGALASMRSMKALEAECSSLRAIVANETAAPVQVPYVSEITVAGPAKVEPTIVRSTVTVAHAYAAPVSEEQNGRDNDSDIEVTEEDMNDPSFQDELAMLGFADDSEDSEHESSTELRNAITMEQRVPVSDLPQLLSTRPSHKLYTVESFDEHELIDEFESDYSEGEGEVEKSSQRAETKSPTPAIDTAPPDSSSETPHATSIDELKQQLDRVRHAALQFKRDGKINEALESMRRAKQIEHLIQLKETAPPSALTPTKTDPLKPNPVFIQKFEELERLLVDFGNRATVLAKESLASDRETASAWLKKRKDYALQLDVLREKRRNPLQPPPTFSVSRSTTQVEYEMRDIPDDAFVVTINSVNSFSQGIGKDVFVRFSLSFPSSAPHEGQTDTFTIKPDGFGLVSPTKRFQFKVQRSRGTLRLFEIKKAVFEVWRPATLFRNPELIARGYQELSPLISRCEINANIPFVGSNRKPTGGDVEVSMKMRRPLRDKEFREVHSEELIIGVYPPPLQSGSNADLPMLPSISHQPSIVQQGVSASGELTQIAANITPDEVPDNDQSENLDPHDLDLIVSYDVINEELEKIEAKLPTLKASSAAELRDRQDSLALKKQLLEIEMQTGKLTLEMYTSKLHSRIAADRQLIAKLIQLQRRTDAARVLHRVKIMEKELEGADGGEEVEEE